jgi:hypothetical protein
MFHAIESRSWRSRHLVSTLLVLVVSTLTTGYSSCAGTTGPLRVRISVTPTEVLLRTSIASGREAIGLARIEGGEAGDRFRATVSYQTMPAPNWLTVVMAERDLTLSANPTDLSPGLYLASVVIEEPTSMASATLRVEFTVTP